MPPTFPDVERLALRQAPLELVVCQLRFPTILALAANQPPDEFQRRIQARYPVTRRPQTTRLEMSAGPSASVSVTPYWGFEDQESQWTVSLGDNFIALETKQYQHFEDFITRFLELVTLAKDLYAIGLRERLGLRYVDRLSRTKYPTLPPDWPQHIRSEAIALRSVRGPGEPQMSHLETRFAFGEQLLAIRSAYGDAGFPGITEDELILDFDCYTERRGDLEQIPDFLHTFRALSYRAFRWVLGDLIVYFEPVHTGETS